MATPPTTITIPQVVCVRVKNIRPQYNDLCQWMADTDNNVYIGRGNVTFIDGQRFPERDSVWANPFVIGVDGTREDVISKYAEYIQRRIASGEVCLQSLCGKKRLGCWCHPEPCHGDVLVQLLKAHMARLTILVASGQPHAAGVWDSHAALLLRDMSHIEQYLVGATECPVPPQARQFDTIYSAWRSTQAMTKDEKNEHSVTPQDVSERMMSPITLVLASGSTDRNDSEFDRTVATIGRALRWHVIVVRKHEDGRNNSRTHPWHISSEEEDHLTRTLNTYQPHVVFAAELNGFKNASFRHFFTHCMGAYADGPCGYDAIDATATAGPTLMSRLFCFKSTSFDVVTPVRQ